MPLPPITPSGGGSGGPYIRNEDLGFWDDEFLEELVHGGVAASPDSSPRGEGGRRTRNGDGDSFSQEPIGLSDGPRGLTEQEEQLVSSGKVFLQHGLPPRLKDAFSTTVNERYRSECTQNFAGTVPMRSLTQMPLPGASGKASTAKRSTERS